MSRLLWIWLSIIILGLGPAAAQRAELSLNGEWERVKVNELTVPPPADGWQPFTVPGYLWGWNYERAWFRRTVEIPAAWAGQRLKLHFHGVKWNSRIYFNAHEVGGHFGGYEPFTLDVTDYARPGQTNAVLVGVHDWTGVFKEFMELDLEANRSREVRDLPRDNVLAPIGGHVTLYGIWDDVTLEAVPPVHVADVWVQTSVRKKELKALLTVANESPRTQTVQVANAVWEWQEAGGRRQEAGGREQRPVLTLPPQTVELRPGERRELAITATWPEPRLWTPEEPNLYVLRTELRGTKGNLGELGGKGTMGNDGESGEKERDAIPLVPLSSPKFLLDALLTRFGFREFWIEGPDFFLNGVKIHLLATSTWPPGSGESREYVEDTLRAIKAANCVCFRTHTQPWRKVWYDAADELGLLMIPEGAVWNDDEVYRIDDPAFWQNYADHLRGMFEHFKNNPSVIAYSLENELYGSRLNDASPAKGSLAELGRQLKRWDPTRPITYESDLDPGSADFLGLHYPHEYPDFNLYPNTCYWLDEPIPMGHAFTAGTGRWQWQRDKPLYIGEFLWVPSSDPSWHTIFFGDEAYTDYHHYRNLGKAWSWRMQIEAYRWYGVSGICPWTMFEGGPRLDESNPLYVAVRETFAPIASFIKEYDSRFFAETEVSRTVTVYNDVLEPSDLTFRWALLRDGETVGQGQREVSLPPAGKETFAFTFRTPAVTERREWTLRTEVLKDGRVQHVRQYPVSVFPPVPEAFRLPEAKIGLYDPAARTRNVLAAQDVPFVEVGSLDELPEGLDVLIVGDRALRAAKREQPVIGRPSGARPMLLDFVRGGGRLLVLAQETYPENLLPTSLDRHASTLAFVQRPDHPILRGVAAEDLRFWRGDHLVSENDPFRPHTEGCRPLVTSGSRDGLNHAPLIEFPRGRGTIVLCQLKLIEKFRAEPVAARLLENALRYLCEFGAETRPVGVLSAEAGCKSYLRGLHLNFEDLTERWPEANWQPGQILLVDRDVSPLLAQRAKVEAFVEQGGKIVLHDLTPEQLDDLKPLLNAGNLRLQPNASPLQLVREAPSPPIPTEPQKPREPPIPGSPTPNPEPSALAWSLLREDLYWLGPHVGVGWSTTPQATNVARFTLGKTLDGLAFETYEAEGMEIQAAIGQAQGEGVILATVGAVRQEIDFPADGTYVFGVVAGGSPCGGIFPNADVRIDNELLGTIGLTRRETNTYTVFGPAPAGRHTVSIHFTNDANQGGEDRNLFVDKLLVARDQEEQAAHVTFLTHPPAVVQFRRGKGFFLLDQVQWDTEQRNAGQAARYITTLLTELGADFARPTGVFIEAEDMTENEGISWFRREANAVYLGSNGNLRTTVACAKEGDYVFEIVGYGTAAEGVYPILELALDGVTIGQVELASSGWRGFPLEAHVTEGQHEIVLTFTNDLWRPPEDRNAWVDKMIVYEKP